MSRRPPPQAVFLPRAQLSFTPQVTILLSSVSAMVCMPPQPSCTTRSAEGLSGSRKGFRRGRPASCIAGPRPSSPASPLPKTKTARTPVGAWLTTGSEAEAYVASMSMPGRLRCGARASAFPGPALGFFTLRVAARSSSFACLRFAERSAVGGGNSPPLAALRDWAPDVGPRGSNVGFDSSLARQNEDNNCN
jgi:hypothetical protein